jgi:formamidopyrimidine-DNA glycosylase
MIEILESKTIGLQISNKLADKQIREVILPTLLSENTMNQPCLVCGDRVKKEAYLGGSVYFCPTCQPL